MQGEAVEMQGLKRGRSQLPDTTKSYKVSPVSLLFFTLLTRLLIQYKQCIVSSFGWRCRIVRVSASSVGIQL